MNAEQFYQSFKDALSYLGYSWGDKDKVRVWLQDGHVWFEADGRTASFEVEGY